MGQTMIVRKMQPQELEATVICFNYYRDEAIEVMPRIAEEYNENSMVQTIRGYAIKNEFCWFNAYEGQRVVGFIGGYVTDCPWNQEIITANIGFVYLLPTHRGLENFKQLMNEFTAWAKVYKATEITAGDIGINVERSRTLYQHLGFKEILLMTKDLDNE
jgi:GNAT superfamily N-acetyltransferase